MAPSISSDSAVISSLRPVSYTHLISRAYQNLYEESPSVMDGLNTSVKAIEELSSFSDKISVLGEEFSDIYYRLEELCREIRDIRESISFSPSELDEAIIRFELI